MSGRMLRLGSTLVLSVLAVAALVSCSERTPEKSATQTAAQDLALTTEQKTLLSGGIETKVYLGERVPSDSYLPVVGLTRGRNRNPSCTGTLVSPDIVVTAAHCVCAGVDSNVYLGNTPREDRDDPYGYYLITDWFSLATCGAAVDGQDIAVVRIAEPIVKVAPAALAETQDIDAARLFKVVGFGAIDLQGKDLPYDKRSAFIAAIDLDCSKTSDGQRNSHRYGCVTQAEIVAGRPGGADTCLGDSGGPLLVYAKGQTGNDERLFRLAGVTSRSVPATAHPCGVGGVYTRLTPQVREWMRRKITQMKGQMPRGL